MELLASNQKVFEMRTAYPALIVTAILSCGELVETRAAEIEPVLEVGSTEAVEVRLLKSLLNMRLELDPPLVLTGEFGDLTKAKVIQFQTEQSLDIDGKVGPKTWQTILEISVNDNVRSPLLG